MRVFYGNGGNVDSMRNVVFASFGCFLDSGPYKGQSPVEWGEQQFVRLSVYLYIHPWRPSDGLCNLPGRPSGPSGRPSGLSNRPPDPSHRVFVYFLGSSP